MGRPRPSEDCPSGICLDWPGHAIDNDGNVIEVEP